jgi:hypothetical protein
MIADPLLRPLLLTLQGLGFFIGLSVDGAMWRGAQDQGEKGWFVAMLWTGGSAGAD